ncbi:unnamed protein product [Polarella glacialis]|uniref:EF-hand domain-containing protein n=1 Tax=Polarella glacialis TaxID=89957 RepID=A0A813E9R9_POLGL|nr:unnamed protein product [Polarella glacialis]CAE8714551.1 unnamed protein product [Polarella glacialis]
MGVAGRGGSRCSSAAFAPAASAAAARRLAFHPGQMPPQRPLPGRHSCVPLQPAWHLHEASRGHATAASTHASPGGSPLQRYEELVAIGDINRDPNQENVVRILDAMAQKLANHVPGVTAARRTPAIDRHSGWLGGLFGSGKAAASPAKPPVETLLSSTGPQGLYVWGGCGTGKTFLMDLFYDSVNVKQKKRIHFHEWMIDVHERLHRLQKKNALVQEKATEWTAEAAMAQREALKAGAGQKSESADDLIVQVANEMLSEAWLLCFDEFQVTHISDAIIMKRLFSILWERGSIIICTSNRPPEDLYLNGLNRGLFLPFIPMIRQFCDVHDIASQVDYRLTTASEEEDRRVYIFPNGMEEAQLLERKFYRICHNEVKVGAQIETQGRRIAVPKTAVNSNVAWFRFTDLCDKPLGAADYLAIGAAFHTVFISDIPKMTLQERDQVRRFITLVDAFYERHTKLVCTAETDPISLFQVSEEDKKNSTHDEVFAWDRTVSRLIEMQSIQYLSDAARNIDGEQFLGQYNLSSLNDDELTEMWRRYDRDDSGEIDRQELRVMLEDILEKHQGHRNLQDDVFALCMDEIDADKNGVISVDEFERYLKDFTVVASTMRLKVELSGL